MKRGNQPSVRRRNQRGRRNTKHGSNEPSRGSFGEEGGQSWGMPTVGCRSDGLWTGPQRGAVEHKGCRLLSTGAALLDDEGAQARCRALLSQFSYLWRRRRGCFWTGNQEQFCFLRWGRCLHAGEELVYGESRWYRREREGLIDREKSLQRWEQVGTDHHSYYLANAKPMHIGVPA